MEIYFYELKKLNPTLSSTIFKMNEEKGELSREILKFYPYINVSKEYIDKHLKVKKIFNNIVEELLDVGQTTATMLFVLKNNNKLNGISLDEAIEEHLKKLDKKGYIYNHDSEFHVSSEILDNVMTAKIKLPKLIIDTNMVLTCLKIDEEAGELVQFAGKKSGMSGEIFVDDNSKINKGIILELIDIMQCCVTMLYILVDKYQININEILKRHINKLKNHGYL